MKSATFLRIALVLTLIHAILHNLGGVFGKPMPGPGEQAVAAMKANHFILMGNPRTYWDFYMGLGVSCAHRGRETATDNRGLRSWLSGFRCLILAILAAKERIPEGTSPGFRRG